MVLGIDFGTTRIVVAAADRGNYPLTDFEGADGHVRDWYPPLAAVRGDERLFGWDAWPVMSDPDWTVIRSLKRGLKDAGPHTMLDLGGANVRLHELMIQMLIALRKDLLTRSSLHAAQDERLKVMLGVPANANSNQRFLTTDAFRAAGFEVLGLLNEPSAASIEFGHREREVRKTPSAGALLVYDLGGGTFDASLVKTEPESHTVLATAGIPTLGGDDFDEILAELALEQMEFEEPLTPGETFRLYEECRERKEALNPNTRKVVIDFDRVREGMDEVSIPVADYYERCRPLVEQTRSVVEDLLASHPDVSIDTLYVTGGGSELPPVSRILKETFGRRVRRSSYMRSATAIGLAITADRRSGFRLKDRLTQSFGVWRESDAGQNVRFDVLLSGGIELPGPTEPPYRIVRSYQPAHNVGHFRYVECSRLNESGEPSGDITVWDDVRFPFDQALKELEDLSSVPVTRDGHAAADVIEEEYSCDSSGSIRVSIRNRSAGYEREYRLGNWSAQDAEPKPTRRRQAGRAKRQSG